MRGANWKAPPNHPDVDPAHEALQLLEGYQELSRLPEMGKRPADFRKWLEEGHASVRELEQLLRASKDKKAIDKEVAERIYRRASSACVQCHAKYRDVP